MGKRSPLDPRRALANIVCRDLWVEELREWCTRLTVRVSLIACDFVAHPLADEVLGPYCFVLRREVWQVARGRELGNGGVLEAHCGSLVYVAVQLKGADLLP